MKASELIGILNDMVAKHGDLDVSCDTQDGDRHSVEDVGVMRWITNDGTAHEGFEIS